MNDTMTREEKMKAAWQAVKKIIHETVKDLGGIPSGHLYAHVRGMMSLDVYNTMLSELKAEGKLSEENFYLTAN